MLGKNEKFGVVIAVSKAYDSATSFVYAREVDGNEFGGSGVTADLDPPRIWTPLRGFGPPPPN